MVISENRKAVIWSGIEKVGTYLVNFIIQIILARLLCPEDYAVVAMLAIFFSISQAFIDSGFATTLIQKQDCSQKDYSSVFFFNILVGITIYLIFYFTAPLIERFYNFNELSLVTRVYSLNLVINSFGLVHRVILTKNLQFKKIAITVFISTIISAVPAIIMAYFNMGYWALVTQSIVSAFLSTAILMYQSKWQPSLEISKTSLIKLAPFGLRILIVYLFHAVYNNIYSLLIGKNFSARELGLYDRGKSLASMGPIGFSDFYTRALYPIQSKTQNDNTALKASYDKSFEIMCLAIVPISSFLFFFAKETIYTLLGAQWIGTTSILQVLCLGYMLYPLQALNMNMLKVKGRADYLLRSEIIKKVTGILCVAALVNFNLKIVVVGWTACAVFEFIVSEYYYWKLYKTSIVKTAMMFFKTFATTCILAFIIHLLVNYVLDNTYLAFFVGGGLFVLTYLLINFKKLKRLL